MCPVCALQRSTILHFPELICQLLLQWQVDPLQYFINVPNYFNIFKFTNWTVNILEILVKW